MFYSPKPNHSLWRFRVQIHGQVGVPDDIRYGPGEQQREVGVRLRSALREAVPYHPDLDHAGDDLESCGADWGWDDSWRWIRVSFFLSFFFNCLWL